MVFNDDMSTCGFFDFPALFRKARGIKNPWRLHQKSANTDQRVLQSSYGAILAAALFSLHQRAFSIGYPTESNWQGVSELQHTSPMSLKVFGARFF